MNRIDKPIYFCDVFKNTRLPIHTYIHIYIILQERVFLFSEFVHALGEPGIDDDEEDEEEEVLSPGY